MQSQDEGKKMIVIIFLIQIVILEHKSIICAGYSAVLHLHTVAEEVTIKNLICLIDKKTGKKTPTRFIMQDQIGIARFQVNAGMICMETFSEFPQMGRFTLRDEGNCRFCLSGKNFPTFSRTAYCITLK